MTNNVLQFSIDKLPGVGIKTKKLLNSFNIYSVKDLLFNVPYKLNYIPNLTREIKNNQKVKILGTVSSLITTRFYNKNKSRSYFTIISDIGSLKVFFFNQTYLKNKINIGDKVLIIGIYNINTLSITASSISLKNLPNNDDGDEFKVTYSLPKGISQKKFSQLIVNSFELLKNEDNEIVDIVPENFKGIKSLEKILYNLHFPKNERTYNKIKKMFAFHELLYYQLKLQLQFSKKKDDKKFALKIKRSDVDFFIKNLPFLLTRSQNSSIEEICEDLKSPYQTMRLLQGDVGCGKTVVVATLIYAVSKLGMQSAIMAPTEILAVQHYNLFKDFYKNKNIKIELITSNTKKNTRENVLEKLEEGEIDVLVGTHSIIQEDVKFKNIKFAVVDEQHRFGVNQRKKILEKSKNINYLMLSATPIPRSMAISLVSNIKITNIDELPSGRQKILTFKVNKKDLNSVYKNLKKELDKGRQAYVVCPLIEESEKSDLKNIINVYNDIKDYFKDEIRVAILNGKMKMEEKDFIMKEFAERNIDILVSTTVIEVGINVPNATYMIIMDANRFGLATLHQLRGRVGRGKEQAYCILVSDIKNERIDIMCIENDGFKIAEFDLKNRGPGDIFGIKQSGLPEFKVANIFEDVELMYLAKKLSFKLLEEKSNREKIMNYINFKNYNY